MCVRLSRTTAIASSAFRRRTAGLRAHKTHVRTRGRRASAVWPLEMHPLGPSPVVRPPPPTGQRIADAPRDRQCRNASTLRVTDRGRGHCCHACATCPNRLSARAIRPVWSAAACERERAPMSGLCVRCFPVLPSEPSDEDSGSTAGERDEGPIVIPP